VLCGLCEDNRIQEAHELFNMMLIRGKAADEVTHNKLIETCHKMGKFDLAFMITENIVDMRF
jgi:pentatricopeptide repeat protein